MSATFSKKPLQDYERLRAEIEACTVCGLCEVGRGPVPPAGRFRRIMVVGEAPGRQEDEYGAPFLGPAGALLWSNLKRLGLERDDCYVGNAVSCYPGRTPTHSEMLACQGNLFKQVTRCAPRFILVLGNIANYSLGAQDSITKIAGIPYQLHWLDPAATVFPALHPSAILRNRLQTKQWRDDLRAFVELTDEHDEAVPR